MHSGSEFRGRLEEVARRVGLGGVPVGVLVTGVVVLVLATALAVWRFWPGAEAPERGPGVEVSKAASPPDALGAEGSTRESASSDTTATAVWVHVVGAVRRPGVYEVPVGSRVGQAIECAGGVLGNGAAEGVNMARPVVDGEQIAVPTRGEWEKAKKAAGPAVAGSGAVSGSNPAGSSAVQPSGEVDINSADATALDTLPGIGPSTAQKIIADREANGPFASPEDLGRVPGIGPRKLEALKGLVCAR